jgi:signal peptidase I
VKLPRLFRVAVEGMSMAPEIRPGDYLVAMRTGRLRPGDLVVVEHPDRPGFEMVKRVTGLPGDRVGDRIMGPGEHWVMGAAAGSTDSRSFGPVGLGAIRGVVRLRYWPPGRIRLFR